MSYTPQYFASTNQLYKTFTRTARSGFTMTLSLTICDTHVLYSKRNLGMII